jgi:hypothetical protein
MTDTVPNPFDPLGWKGPEAPAPVAQTGEAFDHSKPYPEAPEVDHDDEDQEHYRGARDPELATR